MRKFLTTAVAALTLGATLAATAGPAEARDYHRRYYSHRHHGGGNDAAVAAVAGIAGLALGAALSDGNRGRSSSRGYVSSGYSTGYNTGYSYDPRYDGYSGDYYAAPPPRDRVCITRERVWDPYIGRYVSIERRYPC